MANAVAWVAPVHCVPQAPVTTEPHKKGQMTPAHTEGCAVEDKP